MGDGQHADQNDDLKIVLYLSGGGYRAALGGLGAIFFLHHEGLWGRLMKIVSVSGGGLVNGWIATHRPGNNQIGQEITNLFRKLSSRDRSRTVLLLPLLAALAIVALATVGAVLALVGQLPVWAVIVFAAFIAVAVAVVCAVVFLTLVTRVWLRWKYRDFVGPETFGELSVSTWNREHIFVATDLKYAGSVFFMANRVQPLVFSAPLGFHDGRRFTYVDALRATTALPPLLPVFRLRIASEAPRGFDFGFRPEWVHAAGSAGDRASSTWLVDGGVTGNLGIQLDPELSPDNALLLDFANSKVFAGDSPIDAQCAHHSVLAWQCESCRQKKLVVDSSSATPRAWRRLGLLLHLPVVGSFVHSVRSMQVMYESALVDDAAHVKDGLISVVRSERMVFNEALRHVGPRPERDAVAAMSGAGQRGATAEHMAQPEFSWVWMTPLQRIWMSLQTEAARVGTALWAVPPELAARVVASAYVGCVIDRYGAHALDRAEAGIRALDALLGADAKLADWWGAALEVVVSDPPAHAR
jgi:hypothetical protein